MDWKNALLPVNVVDTLSAKSLPPSHLFCSLQSESLEISVLKKSDLEPEILLRLYQIEGTETTTKVEFLGRTASCGEVNLLEEDTGPAHEKRSSCTRTPSRCSN